MKVKTVFFSCCSKNNTERVNKNVVKSIRHKQFVDALFNKKIMRHNIKRIQSKLDITGTYYVCKISLSCFDDKRYILDDYINSLVHFHKDVKRQGRCKLIMILYLSHIKVKA